MNTDQQPGQLQPLSPLLLLMACLVLLLSGGRLACFRLPRHWRPLRKPKP
ncbi:MAG: hypothetical protein R3E79_29015 [Caldilineaceae bacterium]